MTKTQDFLDKVTDFCIARVKPIVMLPTVRKPLNTAWQTFLVVWLASGFSISKVALMSAATAALSALKTSIVEAVKQRKLNIPGEES